MPRVTPCALLCSAFLVSILTMPVMAADEVPKGYSLVKSTKTGRAMSVEKDKPTNVRDAVEAVLNDLDDYFDADYDVFGLYEDQRDHRSGFSPITAKYKGKAVKGFVAARLRDKGAIVAVIFGAADAPPAEWAELFGTPPANTPATTPAAGGDRSKPGAAGEDAVVPEPTKAAVLKAYRFTDGTGSVGLAEGWKTDAASCQNGFQVTGPADQKIDFGISYSVSTPDSTAVAMARQYPVEGQVLLVAPFGEPTDAIAALVPQLSRISQSRGGPALEVDHVAKVRDLPPQSQGSRWAVVSYGVTRTTRDGKKHYQAVSQVGVIPIAPGAWMLWCTQAIAPDETARVDLPTMFAMVGSWRTNDAAIQKNTDAWVADRNAWFANQQAAHKAQTDSYDAQNADWRKNQAAQDAHNADVRRDETGRSRTAADFDETIRGYRDVEDTRTGERKSVNLGNVDDIVNHLNEADPGRYKQIPLRDQ